MGVPVFGVVSEQLALEEVEGRRFDELADWLESMAADALARISDRDREWRACVARVGTSDTIWRGPNGEEVRARMATVHQSQSRPGPGGTGLVVDGREGYDALLSLAGTAREVGRAIDAAQRDHRNRAQAILGAANELAQRAWTNVQDLIGVESDADAQHTRELIDQANRARAAAEAEVDRQLARWRDASGAVAAAIRRATAAYHGAVPEQAPADAGRAAAADPLTQWLDTTAVPFLLAHAGDRRALRTFWEGLSEDRRRALLRLRPDVVEGVLAPVFEPAELIRFHAVRDAERTRTALAAAGLDPDRFDPRALDDLDPLSPSYQELVDRLAADGARMADPAYAAGYVATLGAGGVRATIGALERGLLHHAESTDPEADARRRSVESVLDRFVLGFAAASRSSLTKDVRTDLLAPASRWEWHQLGVLISGPGGAYDARFLAAAAEALLVTHPDGPDHRLGMGRSGADRTDEDLSYPGVGPGPSGFSDLMRARPAMVARKALAENPEAAWLFVWDGQAPRDTQVKALLVHPSARDAADIARSDGLLLGVRVDPDDEAELTRRSLAFTDQALRNVLQVARTASWATADQTVPVYAAMIRVGVRNPMQPEQLRVLAESLYGFLPSIGEIVNDQEEGDDPARRVLGQFDRPDLVELFKRASADSRSSELVGVALATYFADISVAYVDNLKDVELLAHREDVAKEAFSRFTAMSRIMGTVEQGYEIAKDEREESAGFLANGANAILDVAVEAALLSTGLPAAAPVVAEGVKAVKEQLLTAALGAPEQAVTKSDVRQAISNTAQAAAAARIRGRARADGDDTDEAVIAGLTEAKAVANYVNDFEHQSLIEGLSRTPDQQWNTNDKREP